MAPGIAPPSAAPAVAENITNNAKVYITVRLTKYTFETPQTDDLTKKVY
jgi:hypothetical protein